MTCGVDVHVASNLGTITLFRFFEKRRHLGLRALPKTALSAVAIRLPIADVHTLIMWMMRFRCAVLWCCSSLVVAAQDLAPDTVANTIVDQTFTSGVIFPPIAYLLASDGVAYRFASADSPPVSFGTYTWRKTGASTGTLEFSSGSPIVVTFTSARGGTFRDSLGAGTIMFTAFPVTANAPLRNLSMRGTLATSQTMIAGFVVNGSARRRVLVRAIGPSLAQFGVTGAAAGPLLTVFKGTVEIAANGGWGGAPNLAAVFVSVGAFTLPASSRDSALLLELESGNYTAQVRADGGGEVLIEVYFVN